MHTYFILKYFQDSRNDVLACLTAMFVNMPFSKEDHILINNLSA